MKKQNGLIAVAVAAALVSPVYAAEIEFSGAVEVEASSSEDYAGATTSDIVVATAALAVDAKLNNRVSGHLAFLYEEDDAEFDGATFGLDEATLSLQVTQMASLSAGRMFVPFGSFESNMISDPLTLELGETSETAIMLSTEDRGVTASIYAFKGDVDEISVPPATDDDTISYGVKVGYAAANMWMGASYISNIAESDGLQQAGNSVASAVEGMGVNFGIKVNNATLILEHVAAADNFTNGDNLAGNVVANSETPTASNIEVAFNLQKGATFALAYQMTDEAQFLDMPETVMSAAYSVEVMPGTSIGLEYMSMDDYGVADGGSGETATAYTLQMAVEF